jgi:hypothetical protein
MDVQDVFAFLFFSALEWLALLVLTFAIFKFQLPGYWGRLLLSAVMLSFLSHLIFVELELALYGALIQMPVVFLFFWQIFRVPVFYAWLMNVNGYVLYTLIQAVIILAYQLAGVTIVPDSVSAFTAQSITAAIAFVISWLLIRTNWGFTFVPDTDRVRMQWNSLNIRLLVISILGYLVLSSFYFMFFAGYTPLLGLIAGLVVFGILQYLVVKREYHGYG